MRLAPGQCDIARIAVSAALARIEAQLRDEGYVDEESALFEAEQRGWVEGNWITDAGFEVGI